MVAPTAIPVATPVVLSAKAPAKKTNATPVPKKEKATPATKAKAPVAPKKVNATPIAKKEKTAPKKPATPAAKKTPA